MNFRHIEVFVAVMTCGTTTEAAKLLGVSQPSVTTTIQQAEAKLGIRLFKRESGRLVPTAEARILFEEAERAHNALDAFRALAHRLQAGEGGHVRVAAVPAISLELLPDAIARFQSQRGGFSYSASTLNTEEILQQIESRVGMLNLGFAFGHHDDSSFATEQIATADLLAAFPAEWDVPESDPVDLADLGDFPYISGFDSTPVGQLSRNLFEEANLEPRVVARIHTHHIAGRLVQRGMGFAILESVTLRALMHNGRSAAIAVRRIAGEPTIPVSAIFRAQQPQSRQARLFIRCFAQAYEALMDTHDNRVP